MALYLEWNWVSCRYHAHVVRNMNFLITATGTSKLHNWCPKLCIIGFYQYWLSFFPKTVSFMDTLMRTRCGMYARTCAQKCKSITANTRSMRQQIQNLPPRWASILLHFINCSNPRGIDGHTVNVIKELRFWTWARPTTFNTSLR